MGAERKTVQNAVFRGKLHDNKILKVQILLSRNFVVIAQAPIKIPPKPTPKVQPPFRTPEEAFGRRLGAGRHAKGSEAGSWLGALGLDKVAGLGCS